MKNKAKLFVIPALLAMTAVLPSCDLGKIDDGVKDDPTKANITVATYDGGVGQQWILNAAKVFEEKFKDATNFQEGRTGVKINVVANKSYSGGYLIDNSLNKDIYFTENVDYIELANTGKIADLTDILSRTLSDYGEETNILSKIDTNFRNFLCHKEKYYAVPFYDAFYGFVCDLDLWKEERLYISSTGSFTNDLTNLSKGPDNVQNTSDDGFPATYEEFSKLLKKMTDNDISPLSYSTKYDEYILRAMSNFWSNYEGVDEMQLNYTFNGTAHNIVKDINNGELTIGNEDITIENGDMLQKQAGKYYALDFLKNVLCANPQNMKGASTHTAAQSAFVEGKHYGSPVAMLVDGSWWENEAYEAFQGLERGGFERSNYALMPIPHINETKVGNKQTYISQNTSYGVVASNSSNLDLALEFMRFLHTDAQLSAFTAETSMTRALNYEVASEDQAKITSYGKSLIDLKKNNDIVYPYSSLDIVANNSAIFNNDHWAWSSTIQGKNYTDPYKYFTQEKNPSVEAYFNGLYTNFHQAWSNL